jgi:hypothetical protein
VGGLRLVNAGVSAGFTRWQLEHAEPGIAPINDDLKLSERAMLTSSDRSGGLGLGDDPHPIAGIE